MLCKPLVTTGYKVTVTTQPIGPIPVWSDVTLTCTVDPVPPGPLSYVWYTSAFNVYINMQESNAKVFIGSNHPMQALYFCHVQSNGSEVAVGYTIIKPQGRRIYWNSISLIIIKYAGFLIPIGPTEVTYHHGNNIVLEVNISSYYGASYLQSLQWHKDGNPLTCQLLLWHEGIH